MGKTTLNPLENARRTASGGGGGDIGHLEEAIESVDNSLIADVDGVDTHFYLDYKNGKLGYNTDEARGADTFHPFKQGIAVIPFETTRASSTVLNINVAGLNAPADALPGKFTVNFTTMSGAGSNAVNITKTYNPNTKVLTLTTQSAFFGSSKFAGSVMYNKD